MNKFSENQIVKFMDSVLGIDAPNCMSRPASTVPAFNCFELDPVVHWIGGACESVEIEDLPKCIQEEAFDGLVWSLFAHLEEGGRQDIHDFTLRSEAEACFDSLSKNFVGSGS